MDLFENARQRQMEGDSPLANRMRPRTLDEYVGQSHIIGPGRLLRRAIQADQLSSLIFYGPPGTGKTTLAKVISNSTRSHFETINAVLSGVKQIRNAIAAAEDRRNLYNERTVLFVDEVHRWNKAQQDALLPHVENGTVILIGATTENPYFEVNKALVSRSRIFQLKPLTEDDLRTIARAAVADEKRGFGKLDVELPEDALTHLVKVANGDARGVLNALELAIETTDPDADGRIVIGLTVAEESIQQKAVHYDKDGDVHYDTISAFIKSVRGSDPDASLYWLAKMVYAGEDPRFIFRRLTILAGEDIGLAAPEAMGVVVSCWQAFERIGMPEGAFPLTEATLYLATAPKSNSTLAYFDAYNVVKNERDGDVPNHLKDNNRDSEGFGHGEGYLYPHAYRNHWIAQQYLPDALQGKMFYQPTDQGYERGIRDNVARRREEQLAAMVSGSYESVAEVLTNSPTDRAREAWLQRTLNSTGRSLGDIRDRLFEMAGIKRHYIVADINAGTGLLSWEAVRQTPEGNVWSLASSEAAAQTLGQQAEALDELDRPIVLHGTLLAIDAYQQTLNDEPVQFDRIIGRNPFTQYAILDSEARREFWSHLRRLLNGDGQICIAQLIPQQGQRLYKLADWGNVEASLTAKVIEAEEGIYTQDDDLLVNWALDELVADCEAAGLTISLAEMVAVNESRRLTQAHWERWFNTSQQRKRQTYAEHLLSAGISEAAVEEIGSMYRRQLVDRTWPWVNQIAFIRCQ